MTILEFLTAVNGTAQLWAANGQFLGVLSNNQYDSNSISNPHGLYGSFYGINSIRNPYGLYGGSHGMYSPYNAYCMNPPVIFYQGQPTLVVTRNSYASTNGLSVVDPDVVIQVYAPSNNYPLSNNIDFLAQAFGITALFK